MASPLVAQQPGGGAAGPPSTAAIEPAVATQSGLDAVDRGIWENVFDGGRVMPPAPPGSAPPRPLLPFLSKIAARNADDVFGQSGAEYPGDDEGDSSGFDVATADELDEIPFLIPPEHDMPLGFVGPQIRRPTDYSGFGDLFPVADRWRLGFPYWYRYVYGSWCDPYHQNVLKGDYPLEIGGNRFLEITAVAETQVQTRNKSVNLTGTDQDYQFRQRFFLTTDYFVNENTFHPSEWFVRMTHALEYRSQTDQDEFVDYAFQELFVDLQLAIVSEWYDTTDVRIGRQVFANDFRGFLYNDVNNMVRLFGNRDANRFQWNAILIDAVQQDQVSQFLKTEEDRDQIIAGVNMFRQDWPVLGVFVHAGAYFNRDRFRQSVDSYFFEVAAEGVYRGFEFTAAFIQALGRDEANPIAQRAVDVNAQFAALEITRPMDWFIPRASVLWASGDDDPTDGTGRGFDAIFDNPFFAGANFAYFNREQLNSRGLRLSNFNSFLPNLRTKAFEPVNFVNPGILVLTAGVDTVLSARTVAFINYNHYEFDSPEAVEQGVRVKNRDAAGNPLELDVSREIGSDITLGVVYKPLIVDNVVLTVGASRFFSGSGIETLAADNHPELYVAFAAFAVVY
ncbi:MAG TPA: hypothetical protein VML55_03785 [Planctomycetaceae bacterium]|nr:hypothetical protein [Planctomycetaceae bacterium]